MVWMPRHSAMAGVCMLTLCSGDGAIGYIMMVSSEIMWIAGLHYHGACPSCGYAGSA